MHALTRPGRDRLKGPRPHDDEGRRLPPVDRWGHDQLWWLDRMVRTTKPLHERMALVWHDWFATSRHGVDSARLMLNQNRLFRRQGLDSFLTLLTEVTKDPAMLAANLPLRCVALPRPASTTRTPTSRRRSRTALTSPHARCSPSSATSRRAGSPTAC